MNYSKLSVDNNLPHEANVMIEIAANSGSIKYGFNKEISALSVDRIMQCSMQYPRNYNFIPHTSSRDGDPVDVLVHISYLIVSEAIVFIKLIGVLVTENEKGSD